ncbi:MAG: type II toxin-antitoxin system antitoxin SocA domain-containing protein [Candidatus Gracilibacteria bacterium]|jgi:transcriptional regulator with XRE-family HTH domain
MKTNLTSLQIGKIINNLRTQKNISQQRLAETLGIPRSSVSQIENGGRELSFIEFQKILSIFEVSFEEFVANGKPEKENVLPKKENINKKIKFDPEKFKQLFLYILQRCGSKPNVGETVLYKLLYFCDFDYFESFEKPLTGMKYKKMQYGPIPDQVLYNPVINEMRQIGMIERVSRPYLNETMQTRYLNFIEADLSVFGSDIDKMIKIADSVIDRLSGMTARQIEDHSHRDYPWQAHEYDEEIDYSSVFLRSGEFANRDYDEEFIQAAAADVSNSLPPLSKEEYEYYMSLPD